MLFFKLNLDAQLLQVTDGLQQIHRVSCKAGDGFGQDDVDVSRLAFSQHFLKLRPVDLGAGDAVIYLDYENDTRIYGPRPPKNPIK